jgi:hypothetical protein
MDSSSHRDRDDKQRSSLSQITTFLLSVSAFLFALSFVLGVSVYKLATRSVTLEQLSTSELRRLVEKATYVAPPIYQPYPTSGQMLFYHMRPNTRYENILNDTFMTNDLGFRTVVTSPKPEGVKRIVVVGDSWTFGQGVKHEETFTYQLQEMINRNGKRWQVYNLAMPGWNTANETAALRLFFSRLQADAVVFCPTSNDIDDGNDVWNGRTVSSGFVSRGDDFRDSYMYRTRWIQVFKKLGEEAGFLKRQGIPSLIYFLAEWRKLAPYYANLSGLEERYTVVPSEYIENPYRLPPEIDPGGHASPEGHRLIASYLHNALLEQEIIFGLEPLPLKHPVTFPGRAFDKADVEVEFKHGFQVSKNANLISLSHGFMGREGLFSVPTPSRARTVSITFELLSDPGIYPLTVSVQLECEEKVSGTRVFEDFAAGPQTIELRKPESLDAYPIIEVRVTSDRVVIHKDGWSPISMKPPVINVR